MSEMEKFRISGNFWLDPEHNADDVLAHVVSTIRSTVEDEIEVDEAFAQRVSRTVVFAAAVVMFEDESDAKAAGKALKDTPCPWPHDGVQVVHLW